MKVYTTAGHEALQGREEDPGADGPREVEPLVSETGPAGRRSGKKATYVVLFVFQRMYFGSLRSLYRKDERNDRRRNSRGCGQWKNRKSFRASGLFSPQRCVEDRREFSTPPGAEGCFPQKILHITLAYVESQADEGAVRRNGSGPILQNQGRSGNLAVLP